jgi:hypothetical protein
MKENASTMRQERLQTSISPFAESQSTVLIALFVRMVSTLSTVFAIKFQHIAKLITLKTANA